MGGWRVSGVRSAAGGSALVALFAVLILAVLAPACPSVKGAPWPDSGMYLYLGQLVLWGGVPYRDGWSNKPPLICFIDAAGLWLGRGSWLGVWALEVVSLSVAASVSYRMLRRVVGKFAALYATAAWVMSLGLLLDGGNLLEEYALPVQFLILDLFVVAESRRRYGWRGWLIGFLTMVAFCLRQNLIGVGLAVIGYHLARLGSARWRQAALGLAHIGLGGAVGLLLLIAYLAWHGVVAEFWDQSFRFSFEVICGYVSMGQRIQIFGEGLRAGVQAGVIPLTVASWFVGLWQATAARSSRQPLPPVMGLFLIGFPLEYVLASLSYRWYPHHYMAWLPMSSIGIAWFIHGLLSGRDTAGGAAAASPSGVRPTGWLLALLLAMGLYPMGKAAYHIAMDHRSDRWAQVATYVRNATQEDEYVFVWGYQPSVNFLARRRSPTRFFAQYPLGSPGYATRAYWETLLADLQARPPRLIVDASAAEWPFPPPDLEQLVTYFTAHYALVDVINGCPVYRYQG